MTDSFRRSLAKRALQGIFVVWAAFTLTFALLYVLPYDAVDVMYNPSDGQTLTNEQKDNVREHLGLGGSAFQQYFDQLSRAVHGDFGTSVVSGENVSSLVLTALPHTALLTVAALSVALPLAAVVAVTAAYTRSKWLGNLLAAVPSIGVSMPIFLVGLVLLQVFSFRLGWFPPMGDAGLGSIVLPATTLALPVSAPIAQVLITNLEAGMRSPYVVVARAKGATRWWALIREVVRNSVLPAVTMLGIVLGNLLAGAIIVETVFSRPGLGRLTELAVRNQDFRVLQAVVVVVAITYVIANYVVDTVYPLLDPRLRSASDNRSTSTIKSLQRSIR
ncbi:ABC transporter permease [Rhodococcus globerulus]|uniref:ABC transporter permease n=1 Tax=Rhodococcus globerulus TaxID=33008 RepID=A0ABU4C403_RHOGO|nr:ABC transporter permease [Rhodococcus globerulus]MDV6271001.1 ABC transporter permease [Rhodococcus globerulus]